MLYSDGITEAEDPSGVPFDESGLLTLISAHAGNPDLRAIGAAIIKAVERHAQDVRFADDLTVLLARRPDSLAALDRDSGDETPAIPPPISGSDGPDNPNSDDLTSKH